MAFKIFKVLMLHTHFIITINICLKPISAHKQQMLHEAGGDTEVRQSGIGYK